LGRVAGEFVTRLYVEAKMEDWFRSIYSGSMRFPVEISRGGHKMLWTVVAEAYNMLRVSTGVLIEPLFILVFNFY